MSLRVAIAGGNGRMGQALVALVTETAGMSVSGVSLAPGEDAPLTALAGSVPYSHDLGKALAGADVLIDFTVPQTAEQHARVCSDNGIAWVLGTTGLDASHQARVQSASQQVAVCQSANFSSGVNLMLRLVELAAQAVDDDTDLEVIEAHHRHKVDAPSGTALAIGQALAAGRGIDLDGHSVMTREGITGPRPDGAIGFATVRAGDIVGDHTALFASDGERIEITHRAGTRLAFARGALRAARWLVTQPAGHYDMQDVLQLRQERQERQER